MTELLRPRHPVLQEIAGIGLRAVLTAAGCGLLALAVALMAGCAHVTPDSIIEPMAAAGPAGTMPAPSAPRNGAIFADASYRPIFEDRRARLVGDTLIISIAEKTSAGKNVASSGSRDGKSDLKLGPGFLPGLRPVDIEGSNALSHTEKAAANAANNFTGTVTAIVTEVLPNGNLKVRGEKQVAFDRGTEFIRFSGIVNPATISASNSVPSTAVAEMRVEYRTNTRYDMAALQMALARFFLSVLPL